MNTLFFDESTPPLVGRLAQLLLERRWQCATAESCTGGLVGAALTAVPGSSVWYKGGIIAYDNAVKADLLGVSSTVLRECGAVNEAVAVSMARGVCRVLNVQAALAVTGVAGPDGGTAEKPVGTVWIGWAIRLPESERAWASLHHFAGSREEVRLASRHEAIAGLVRALT